MSLTRSRLNKIVETVQDLDCRENIEAFVQQFCRQMLADPQLAPIFLDVAGIQIEEHFPRIISYWEKLLLGKTDYQRHTMNIHREVDAQQQFTSEDFVRWYALFEATANQSFAGDKTERAKRVAKKIANNMAQSLGLEKPLG